MFGGSKWPNTTASSLPVAGDHYLLAPLWLRVSPTCFFLYPVSVATLDSQQGQGLPYLKQISNFISNSTGNAFSAKWMMVAQWKNVPVLCEQDSNETGKVCVCVCVCVCVRERERERERESCMAEQTIGA